ncbi:MAG TPA: aminotransferase class I/II-fold pyridoxal phosphate-dependent enzyme, partial [Beijerinckiaceae bacterium]|nr:aminotransferase class I/II-fold pyridoxal phosphate-dependent enzyme [Beijerinckiaceae bacterium]
MSLAERLARPEILAMPPLDLEPTPNLADVIKLDANENPFPPLAGGAFAANVNRYPESRPQRLRDVMAALYGVQPDQLLVARGGDDVIDLLCRTFLRGTEDAVAVSTPTFTAYAHYAKLRGARIIELPLGPDFAFSADRIIDGLSDETNVKLAFVCAPNNPTGTAVDAGEITALADRLPDTLILLDEAYLDFGDTPSLAAEAVTRPNLLVLKTLSKAWGLAGARVGALIGPADTVALVSRALPHYPLPTLSIAAALDALQPSRRLVQQQRIA